MGEEEGERRKGGGWIPVVEGERGREKGEGAGERGKWRRRNDRGGKRYGGSREGKRGNREETRRSGMGSG